MEKSLNKVDLKGNVGVEPKITVLENGAKVIRFSVATHEAYKGKEGEFKEETTWHNVVAWATKNMPDFQMIKKGQFVEVSGRLKYSRYKTKTGEDRYTTEIVAARLILPGIAADPAATASAVN